MFTGLPGPARSRYGSPRPPELLTSVELHWLRVGYSRQLERVAFRGGRWRGSRSRVVRLVRHPGQGVVLSGTGYEQLFFAATRRLPTRLYRELLRKCRPCRSAFQLS